MSKFTVKHYDSKDIKDLPLSGGRKPQKPPQILQSKHQPINLRSPSRHYSGVHFINLPYTRVPSRSMQAGALEGLVGVPVSGGSVCLAPDPEEAGARHGGPQPDPLQGGLR